VTVDSVGEEVVGPTEIRRYLGQELGDSVALEGSTVLVKASMPTRTFTADGQTYSYVEGLAGHADVRVRTQSILVLLVPSLKALKTRS
jgi:membrane fusion protein (multidrug efflux system)